MTSLGLHCSNNDSGVPITLFSGPGWAQERVGDWAAWPAGPGWAAGAGWVAGAGWAAGPAWAAGAGRPPERDGPPEQDAEAGRWETRRRWEALPRRRAAVRPGRYLGGPSASQAAPDGKENSATDSGLNSDEDPGTTGTTYRPPATRAGATKCSCR